MGFRLVDSKWSAAFDHCLKKSDSPIRVICPFIKERALRRLLQGRQPALIEVITRFDLDGFLQGASDISALRYLYEAGAKIRGVKNLHAKVYLIGSHAIVGSANLTEKAINHNHEFGFVSDDDDIFVSCNSYFDRLWGRAGSNLKMERLAKWESRVTEALASGAGSRVTPKLGDEGADVGLSPDEEIQPDWATTANQGFVKFFGDGTNRLKHSIPVLEEVDGAGSHWACSYPATKRPRSVQDGALMFMGRLVVNPNDTMIYGRAIGLKYIEGRDDATREDIAKRPWKAKWSRYIRVHDAEFVNGNLGEGVSLNELMETFGARSFASTARNLAAGRGNTDPRKAYSQQAQVELTPQAMEWLNGRLEQCFSKNGKLSPSVMSKLDWPEIQRLVG